MKVVNIRSTNVDVMSIIKTQVSCFSEKAFFCYNFVTSYRYWSVTVPNGQFSFKKKAKVRLGCQFLKPKRNVARCYNFCVCNPFLTCVVNSLDIVSGCIISGHFSRTFRGLSEKHGPTNNFHKK